MGVSRKRCAVSDELLKCPFCESENVAVTGWKYQGVREHVRHDGTEPDKLRAWREAVVLCAAAVGERMKGGAR